MRGNEVLVSTHMNEIKHSAWRNIIAGLFACCRGACSRTEMIDGMEVMPTTHSADPGECLPREIDDFVALVLAGGEVTPNGLRARVVQAFQVAFLRERGCLIGVGGLKRPSIHHRAEVAAGSNVPIPETDFPFELGWVFIVPSARGRRLSVPLCESLVGAAEGRGIFSTSRQDNAGMHTTLCKLGFVRVGDEWPSQECSGAIALFLKYAA